MTRLRLRSWRFLPLFAWYAWRIVRQVKRASGFRTGALARDPDGGFWTFTVWEDEEAMKAFRDADPHLSVMPKLVVWCSEASFAHWEQETAGLPDPGEVLARMEAEGELSNVRRPSRSHAAGETAPTSDPPAIRLRISPAGA